MTTWSPSSASNGWGTAVNAYFTNIKTNYATAGKYFIIELFVLIDKKENQCLKCLLPFADGLLGMNRNW